MNVAIWEHCTFHNEIFKCDKFTTLTPLSLFISCKFPFPTLDLKLSPLSTVALRSHNNIFV
jgi:hypothetical protein